MSAREWEPGDVAIGTWRGATNVRLVRWANGWVTAGDPDDYLHDETIEFSDDDTDTDFTLTDLRPLVVIDPESVADVNRLTFAYESLRDMGGALRSLLEPPRPAEPTTWGVVEASCVHSDERRNWIHHDDGNWWPAEKYGDATARLNTGRDPRLPDDWDSLLQPVVIREGVTA